MSSLPKSLPPLRSRPQTDRQYDKKSSVMAGALTLLLMLASFAAAVLSFFPEGVVALPLGGGTSVELRLVPPSAAEIATRRDEPEQGDMRKLLGSYPNESAIQVPAHKEPEIKQKTAEPKVIKEKNLKTETIVEKKPKPKQNPRPKPQKQPAPQVKTTKKHTNAPAKEQPAATASLTDNMNGSARNQGDPGSGERDGSGGGTGGGTTANHGHYAGTTQDANREGKILAALLHEVEARKKYPKQARRIGAEGKVMLQVKISGQGRITACAIAKPSGKGVLDKATAELGEKLTGLEIPQARGGASVTILIPVYYVLH